ncbi:BnaCnng52710D [Brassica napus]|uniref:BnaCnng52710D protein n=1 Tax=Brassica napus TaxID=3708 RepID=A0A078JMA6_BRANA|nr:BnaCnng52710D [Brassica napus]
MVLLKCGFFKEGFGMLMTA